MSDDLAGRRRRVTPRSIRFPEKQAAVGVRLEIRDTWKTFRTQLHSSPPDTTTAARKRLSSVCAVCVCSVCTRLQVVAARVAPALRPARSCRSAQEGFPAPSVPHFVIGVVRPRPTLVRQPAQADQSSACLRRASPGRRLPFHSGPGHRSEVLASPRPRIASASLSAQAVGRLPCSRQAGGGRPRRGTMPLDGLRFEAGPPFALG